MKGFLRIDSFDEIRKELIGLLREEKEYFSGMMSKRELGKIIEAANRESSYEGKAEKFLDLIRSENIGKK